MLTYSDQNITMTEGNYDLSLEKIRDKKMNAKKRLAYVRTPLEIFGPTFFISDWAQTL